MLSCLSFYIELENSEELCLERAVHTLVWLGFVLVFSSVCRKIGFLWCSVMATATFLFRSADLSAVVPLRGDVVAASGWGNHANGKDIDMRVGDRGHMFGWPCT